MMNYLKKFESFQTNEEIHKICREYFIVNYTINSDGSIDVNDDVYLYDRYLEELPLKFNHVSGNFNCYRNKLTTLEGAPQSVDGYFNCSNNKLTTLQGGPQSVGGDFNCHNNKLTTLESGPQSVDRDFYCTSNYLTTLEGAPQSVGGDFDCSYNKLTTLEGAPQSVGGYFDCSYNKLTTLEGGPQSVGGSFDCENNIELKSLKYLPEYVTSEIVFFQSTAVYEIFKLLLNISIGMIRLVNDLKVVVDDKIDIEILNDLLYDQGRPPVENVIGYDNI